MFHYTYMITHPSGKYYVGRHSTKNFNDNYLGSGKWVKSIKDKNTLEKYILEMFNSFSLLVEAEGRLIKKEINNPLNMNFNNSPVGFATGDLNPARSKEEIIRRSKYNWMKTESGRKFARENNPSKLPHVKQILRLKAYEKLKNGTHNFQNQKTIDKRIHNLKIRMRDDNPMYKESCKLQASQRARDQLKNGVHNFQNPEVCKKRNLLVSARMTENNPMKDPRISELFKKPKERVTCPHCNKIGGKPVMMRYHFAKCKVLIKSLV